MNYLKCTLPASSELEYSKKQHSDFQLHQDLLNTLPASSEEYSVELILKRAGTDLVVNIRRFPFSRCKIYSASVNDENLELTEMATALTHHPSPAAEKGLSIKESYFLYFYFACL